MKSSGRERGDTVPEMLIGGEWRQGAAKEELEVINPATEEVVDSVPAGSPDDVEFAVATAKRAFGEWSRTDVEKRAAVLAKAAALIDEQRQVPRRDFDLRTGQAARRGDRRGDAPGARRPLLRRGRDQGPRRLPGAALDARARVRSGDPPADGRVRRDHSLQLSADPAGDEGGPGGRVGEHGCGQAGGDDAAGHVGGGPAVRRGGRCPTGCSTWSPGGAR